MGEFANFLLLQEMPARRSFKRTLGKYEPQDVKKPVATLTAWRRILYDPEGKPYPERVRRRRNDAANEKLKANIKKRGLSHFPVVGAGQEPDEESGLLSVNKENSFVVQPIGNMPNAEFLRHVRELLWNPTGEVPTPLSPGPHTQWGATVKLPGSPQAFLSHHPGETPAGPDSYNVMTQIGTSAEPRVENEPNYTQMKYGPRATPPMMDPLDQPGDVGNQPDTELPGRRFTIRDKKKKP